MSRTLPLRDLQSRNDSGQPNSVHAHISLATMHFAPDLKFSEVWRLILPMFIGLICPFGYILVPLACASGDGAGNKVEFWSFVGSTAIWLCIFGNAYFNLMCIGLLPLNRTWPCWLSCIATVVWLPVALFLVHHFSGNDPWTYYIGLTGGPTLMTVPILLAYGLGVFITWLRSGSVNDGHESVYISLDSTMMRSIAVDSIKNHALLRDDLISFQTTAATLTSLNSLSSSTVADSFQRHETMSFKSLESPLPNARADSSQRQELQPMVLRSLWLQWLLLILLLQTIGGVFMLLEWELRLVINAGGLFRRSVYIIYMISTVVLKDILKAIGFVLDCGKQGTDYNGYYVGELLASLFYFLFYRMMFDSVTSWELFAYLHCIHLTCEWLFHPMRATRWYYQRVRRFVERLPRPLNRFCHAVLLTAQPGITADDWACFMALDTAVRGYIQLFSVVVYMGGFTWLRFGYNKNVFPSFRDLPRSRYEMLMMQNGVLLITEALNTLLMELWYRWRLGPGGSLRRLGGLLQSNIFLASFTLSCTTMGTDLWLAFVPKTFCDSF